MELLRQTGTGPPRFPPHPQRRRQHARGESWRPGEDLNPRPAAEKSASTLRNNHRLPSQACSGRQTAALRRTALRRAAAPLWPCCIVKLSPESGQTQTLSHIFVGGPDRQPAVAQRPGGQHHSAEAPVVDPLPETTVTADLILHAMGTETSLGALCCVYCETSDSRRRPKRW